MYDAHPNTDALGMRDMWINARHLDSRSLDITFSRYGGKVAYHKLDEIITYWKKPGAKASVIRAISQDKLGQHMADVIDLLSRNALLSVPYKRYVGDAGQKFGGIGVQDKMTVDMIGQIHLGMATRDVPYAQGINGGVGNIVCITSPSVLYDLRYNTNANEWLWPIAYAQPTRLLNHEFGTYLNVRFISSPKCILYNAGEITVQAVVSSAIQAGDGAPSTRVDGVYKTGQSGVTNYIQLGANDANGDPLDMDLFQVDQVVTIHVARTNDNGVTNGVDYTDGKLHNRRIVAVNTGSRRLSFEEPIFEDFDVDLDSSTYAYVTLGRNIHASIFVGGDDGIVMGVGEPPRLYNPPPVDDFLSVYRFSWDAYMGWGVHNPKVLEVVFSAAPFRNVGPLLAG
jgi:hypothetical protein